jgi:Flp pilus assembly protein TadG
VPSLKRNERGLSQSVQYAVIMPTLMLATLGIIQAGMWIHGENVAARASNAAADVARGSFGTASSAQEAASDLATAGGLSDVHVSVSRGATQVTVTVSAKAPSILDMGLGRIQETASAPLERVTQP